MEFIDQAAEVYTELYNIDAEQRDKLLFKLLLKEKIENVEKNPERFNNSITVPVISNEEGDIKEATVGVASKVYNAFKTAYSSMNYDLVYQSILLQLKKNQVNELGLYYLPIYFINLNTGEVREADIKMWLVPEES